MIELRWVKDENGNMQLQQRTREVYETPYGAISLGHHWTQWHPVPIVPLDDFMNRIREGVVGMEQT